MLDCIVMEIKPGFLNVGEAHPAASNAMEYIASLDWAELSKWQESFSSCAIDGNRLAEICSETLRRLMAKQPVSDRYLLGLAWTIQHGVKPRRLRKDKGKSKVKVSDTE